MIGHHQLVSQHLQGVEGGINHNLCLRHLSLDGIGKAKEQRVATGEDNKSLPLQKKGSMSVSLKDIIQRYCDVNPFCTFRQQGCHYLMMALATREHFAILDYLHDLWCKPRLRVVRNANDDKLHSGSKFFTLHSSFFTLKGRVRVSAVLRRQTSGWHCIGWRQGCCRPYDPQR